MARIGAGLLVAASFQACTPRAAPPPTEMVLAAVPDRLRVGEAGSIEVRIAPGTTLTAARLTVRSSDPRLSIEPYAFELGTIAPVRAPTPQASSPPNPPALGVVPVYTVRIKAGRPGTYGITAELKSTQASLSKDIVIGVTE